MLVIKFVQELPFSLLDIVFTQNIIIIKIKLTSLIDSITNQISVMKILQVFFTDLNPKIPIWWVFSVRRVKLWPVKKTQDEAKIGQKKKEENIRKTSKSYQTKGKREDVLKKEEKLLN